MTGKSFSKTPLIVIGGWGVDAAMLEPVVRDWPGLVRFVSLTDDAVSGCSNVNDLASKLVESYPEPAVWMGWSLGAQVAMAASAMDNSPVERVITLSGFPRFVADVDWPFGMEKATFDRFCRDYSDHPSKTWRRFHQLLIQGVASSEMGHARRDLAPWVAVGSLAGVETLQRCLSWLENGDQRPIWRSPSVPVLHLLAEHDALIGRWGSDSQYSPASVALVIVPGMTHWPRGAAADRCAKAIRQFFRLEEAA